MALRIRKRAAAAMAATSVTLLLLLTCVAVAQTHAQAPETAGQKGQQQSPPSALLAPRQAHESEPANPPDSDASSYRPAHPLRLWLGLLHAGVSYDLPTNFVPNATVSLYAEAAFWIAPSSLGVSARFPRQQHSGGYFLTGIGIAPAMEAPGMNLLLVQLIGGWQSPGSLFCEVGAIVTPPLNIDESRRWEVNPIAPLVRFGLRL